MQSEQIFKKILVPVESSIPSLVAQELTAFIAKKLDSKVTVLSVVSHEYMVPGLQKFSPERHDHVPLGTTVAPQLPAPQRHVPTASAASLSKEVASEITNWYHQRGEQAIAEAVALFKEEGIPVDHKLVEHADPAETIIKEAEERKYDLIVMGYSGEEEKEPHFGSVAEKVTRHTQIPILIAREKRKVSKILVPIDGSENAENALRYAVILARKTGSKITLLHVQESGVFSLKPELTKEIGTRILASNAGKIKGIEVAEKLESGDPAKVIVQAADKENCDLIVMGSRGLGTIARFLLGSVSDHVSHYANRSVLIIK